MFGKWWYWLLRKLSDWSDRPARWVKHWDLRLAKPVGSTAGLARLAARWQRAFFYGLKWLSNLLDQPLKWYRRWRPKGRKQPNRVSKLGVAERRVGKFLRMLLRVVRYPFDRLERLFAKRKPQRSVNSKLAEQQLKLELQRKRAEQQHLKTLAKTWPGRLGRYLIVPVSGLWIFVRAYWRTRSMALVWWSIPVVIVFGILGSVYFQKFWIDPSTWANRYQTALVDAIKAGETERANRFRLKLEQLGVLTDRGEYQTALALAAAGDLAAAYEKMLQIAPPNRPGFPGAHAWIVEHLLDKKLDVPPEQAPGLVLQHLDQLRIRVGVQDDLLFFESYAYYRSGDLGRARQLLEQIDRRFPAANMLLLDICLQQNQLPVAREVAVVLHLQLNQAEDQGRELSLDELGWRAAATHVIGDERLAVTAVEQWYRANPNSPEARERQAQVLLARVDRNLRAPQPAVEQLVADLNSASQLVGYENMVLVHRRCREIERRGPSNPAIAKLKETLLEDAETSGPILEYFGAVAAVRGDWQVAERILAAAVKNDPQWPAAWNNWAYVLNQAYPERRLEAVEYVNRAVELSPLTPEYLETRGMIFFNLQRYSEAIADLEIAINGTAELESIHLALAKSYEAIGEHQTAVRYFEAVSRNAKSGRN